ncbi:hypothetical protein EDB85DRAFT_1218053 [Lactarius pseudohatsudake]|nr:hypothetical protein EDB85DRAFT_1218053 [Lactarius pseudohatsudake]
MVEWAGCAAHQSISDRRGYPTTYHINNTNIQDQPIIDLRIDDLRWDFDVLYKPLADLIGRWITPPASLQDAEWEKFVKTAVPTANHPLGIAGIVDPGMKILYGLTNVRVVDAADILRKEWNLNSRRDCHDFEIE